MAKRKARLSRAATRKLLTKVGAKTTRVQPERARVIAKRFEAAERMRKRLPMKGPAQPPPEMPERPIPEGVFVTPPTPITEETRKPFETQILYTQVQKQRAKSLVIAIRTSFYLPGQKEHKGKPTVRASHKRGSNLYQRDVRKGTIAIRGRVQYIRIAKGELKRGALEKLVERTVKNELKVFYKARHGKAKFNSFTASIQVIKGKVVNPYTVRVAANGKVSRAAYFPAFSRETVVEKKRKKKTKADLEAIEHNALITMQSMLYNVYEYGLVNRWSAKESRQYRKSQRKTDRETKLGNLGEAEQ
jgi:hypothetical protein